MLMISTYDRFHITSDIDNGNRNHSKLGSLEYDEHFLGCCGPIAWLFELADHRGRYLVNAQRQNS